MNSILIRNTHTTRFDLVDPSPVSEEDFEKTVLEVLREIHPECWVVPFKPTIQNNGEGWRPDLALVDRLCRYWFVLEVEIATHSLQKHVLPQVIAFKQGDYDGVEIALAASLGMSAIQTATLVRYVPRYIGVVSNQYDPAWLSELNAHNVQYISIAEFSGDAPNKNALLVSGRFVAGELSVGFARVLASQQVMVADCADWMNAEYIINSPEGANTWICSVENGKAWFTKKRGLIRFPEGSYVQIMKSGERLYIRPLTQ